MNRTRPSRLRTCFLAAVIGVQALAPALADEAMTPRLRPGKPLSIQAYGTQNPSCLEWTDGCVLCVSEAGHARCSMPGIACQPAGLTCKRKAGL